MYRPLRSFRLTIKSSDLLSRNSSELTHVLESQTKVLEETSKIMGGLESRQQQLLDVEKNIISLFRESFETISQFSEGVEALERWTQGKKRPAL